MLSDLTAQELEFAREEIRNLVNDIPETNRVDIIVDDEVIKLAETYITEGALTNI